MKWVGGTKRGGAREGHRERCENGKKKKQNRENSLFDFGGIVYTFRRGQKIKDVKPIIRTTYFGIFSLQRLSFIHSNAHNKKKKSGKMRGHLLPSAGFIFSSSALAFAFHVSRCRFPFIRKIVACQAR